MPSAHDRVVRGRQRLAALVTQRRAHLGWSKEEAASKAGIAYMTYDRIENADGVQAGSRAKVERALGLAPGSMKAVIDGAMTLALEGDPLPDADAAPAGGSSTPRALEQLPPRIIAELEEGQVLDTGVYDLSPGDGSGAQLIVVIKGPSSATPEQIRKYMQEVRRAERHLRRISDDEDA